MEFKDYQHQLGNDILDTVCSFSNRDGGLIIIGVEDKTKKIVGVPKNIIDQMQREFTNRCSNPETFEPRVFTELQRVDIDQETSILYAEIVPSQTVVRLNHKVYDRRNDADINITSERLTTQRMEMRKGSYKSEDIMFDDVIFKDLRTDLIEKAKKLAISNNANHPWKEMTEIELLENLGLMKVNNLTGREEYSLACILLFGKDSTIAARVSSNRTDCLVKVKNVERYDDRDNIETNLFDTYERMTRFVEKHLDDRFALDENSVRYSVRNRLFREAIANSIIHREYGVNGYGKMIIEKDRVLFDNEVTPQS